MKNKIFISLILAGLCMACNNGDKSDQQKDITVPQVDSGKLVSSTRDTLQSGCYASINNRDTILMQVNKKGSNITGSLSYNLYQKDRNDGSFVGEIQGDTLTGWYLFRSEGIMSVRQVAWKINSDQLLPASGSMIQRSDTAAFADPLTFQFDTNRPLKKTECTL